MILGLGMYHWGCGAYQVCSNGGIKLTLTYLTSRSNLRPNAFKLNTRGVQYVMKTAQYILKFYIYTLHDYFYSKVCFLAK